MVTGAARGEVPVTRLPAITEGELRAYLLAVAPLIGLDPVTMFV